MTFSVASEAHAVVRPPSKFRLDLTGLSWEVGMDPCDDLFREPLVHAVGLIHKLVVSALDEFS